MDRNNDQAGPPAEGKGEVEPTDKDDPALTRALSPDQLGALARRRSETHRKLKRKLDEAGGHDH